MVLSQANVHLKIRHLEAGIQQALLGHGEEIPLAPAREVLPLNDFKMMPPKMGIGTPQGRARLLHDLANIELQAMELAYRGLLEYPDAPEVFRQELAALALSEGSHLQLCLDGLAELGFQWGSWPTHLGLWAAVRSENDLLDRVLIVHRYLEGSGLDAGTTLLARLEGMPLRDGCWHAVKTIHREEIGHVDFGSRWFRLLCKEKGLDPADEYKARMNLLRNDLPYRTEPLAIDVRRQAGFSTEEIEFLEQWRKTKPPRKP